VFVARVHLDALTERDTDGAVADRLLAALPGLAQHHCAAGAPGGFVARLREGTYYGTWPSTSPSSCRT
jgi:cyanophycin synthetase